MRNSLIFDIEVWCNGNTSDFDSLVAGSIPAAPAIWEHFASFISDNFARKTNGSEILALSRLERFRRMTKLKHEPSDTDSDVSGFYCSG